MKFNKLIVCSLCMLLCVSCGKKEDIRIKEYDTMMKCNYEFKEVVDDDDITSMSNIYLDYDENKMVEKAIYQSISEYSSSNDVSMYEEIIKIYNSLSGIKADVYVVNDSLVLEIEYNYLEMDLDEIKDKLFNILDDDSLLKKTKELPISLEDFKKIELANYECEVK